MNGAADRRVYADHAATTPVRDEVLRRMADVMADGASNPSSLHAEGRRARAVLEDARERVARVLGAEPREIVFTGGGSEADTLAIRGAAPPAARARGIVRPAVVSVVTEHQAVLHAVASLADDGFDTTLLPVGPNGELDPDAFAAALDRAAGAVVLASVMLANNEIGTIAPIAKLAAAARARGVLLHVDAVQAPGKLPLDVRALGADLLALSGHKFYGPKGVGVLFVRDGVAVAPQTHGGGQEAGRRAGTENLAGIAGLALALELAEAERGREASRLAALRDGFEARVRASVPDVRFAASAARLPHLSSFAVPGTPSDVVLARLDLDGAAVSGGSACAAGALEPSHVIAALDVPEWVRHSTVRVSFGRSNGERDVVRLAGMVANVAATREPAPLFGHRLERF